MEFVKQFKPHPLCIVGTVAVLFLTWATTGFYIPHILN